MITGLQVAAPYAVGDDETFVSMVQLAEVAFWASTNKLTPREMVGAVKEIAWVVHLDE